METLGAKEADVATVSVAAVTAVAAWVARAADAATAAFSLLVTTAKKKCSFIKKTDKSFVLVFCYFIHVKIVSIVLNLNFRIICISIYV